MIRGPVLPQSRESLWSLVAGRLESIEQGLHLVLESLDCSHGQLGAIDGLARDAANGPVLVVLAHDGDPLVLARTLGALDFLARVGDALAVAIPEAQFASGSEGRVLVVGADHSAATLEQVGRQPMAGLHVCRLEPFRIAGSERFAVRWLRRGTEGMGATGPLVMASASAVEFAAPPALASLWQSLRELCLRIDGSVRIDGDRFRRRITWHGHPLAEVVVVAGNLIGTSGDGRSITLATAMDLRTFSDRILRVYAQRAGLAIERPDPVAASEAAEQDTAPRHAGSGRNGAVARSDSLRSVAAAARLSPEEYSALGSPTSAVGGEAEGAAVADDVARIVAAQESPWAPRGRTD
ncbi:MAG: hypothetical protein JNK15_07970 [Planctomycetes bacterium]|nr:hypothetical protein [Planctomycetota bacterium]